MLSWRPMPDEMRFVRSDSQPWAEGLKEGSHRFPSKWLEQRYDWVSEEGGAQKPAWGKCGQQVKAPEDMSDVCFHGKEGQKMHLNCCKEVGEELAVVIECDDEGLDARTTKALAEQSRKLRRNAFVDELLTKSQGGGAKKDKVKMRRSRKMERRLIRHALREWRKEQRLRLKHYSRRQLIEALIPIAGRKSKKNKKDEVGKDAASCSKKKAKALTGSIE